MKIRNKANRTSHLAALAAAAILALTGVATVQAGGGHGPGHGPGAGIDIEHVLGALKGKLNLNTSQQLMWDNAVAQTRAAHTAARANMQKVHGALTAELAKADPDLVAVAAVADSTQSTNQTMRHDVRNLWLQIYGTFSPDQKAVVRDALSKRLARMESFRAKMQEHIQKGG